MPNTLTKEYIEDHKLTIHNYESWGKALAEKILTEASSKADGTVEKIKLDVPITIEANTKGCISVCAWGVCIHIDV